ncbi:MAG: hypothetical protein ABIZ05_11465 [Pseudonocardiaceae bacterium]
MEIRSSYTLRRGVGTEKDTKTHQMRRIALDTETIVLLREHKDRCQARMNEFGIEFDRPHCRRRCPLEAEITEAGEPWAGGVSPPPAVE